MAAIEHTFNRLIVKLTGTIADYDYTDTGNTALSGPVPFVDIADYTETEGALRSHLRVPVELGRVHRGLDQ